MNCPHMPQVVRAHADEQMSSSLRTMYRTSGPTGMPNYHRTGRTACRHCGVDGRSGHIIPFGGAGLPVGT